MLKNAFTHLRCEYDARMVEEHYGKQLNFDTSHPVSSSRRCQDSCGRAKVDVRYHEAESSLGRRL